MSLSTTALFCCLDDFAHAFKDWERHNLIPTGRTRRRKGKLSLGEILFIMVLFHLIPFKTFKDFWFYGIEQKHRDCFGDLPAPRLFAPLCVLMHSLSKEETGIYIADSIKLAVCANPRISRNRTFKGLADIHDTDHPQTHSFTSCHTSLHTCLGKTKSE